MRISKLLTVALGATFLTTFACALTSAEALSLKWARGADALTLDPHGQNEGPTIAFNNQVYETLIARDNAHKLVPGLAVACVWGRVWTSGILKMLTTASALDVLRLRFTAGFPLLRFAKRPRQKR